MKYEAYVEKNIPSLEGKRFLVTGANSGLGYSACKTFLSKGAAVIMACRNLTKAEKAKKELLELYPNGKIDIVKVRKYFTDKYFPSLNKTKPKTKSQRIDEEILSWL